MDARLLVVGGKANKGSVKLRLPSTIGRSSSAGVTIGHPMVSRKHCELVEVGGLLMLRDLGSTNGTFFQGKRVKETPLPPNSEFTVGPLTFRVEYKYAGNLKKLPKPIFFAAPVADEPAADASEPDFEVIGELDDDQGPVASAAAATPEPAAADEDDFLDELGVTAAAPAEEALDWIAEEDAAESPAAAAEPDQPAEFEELPSEALAAAELPAPEAIEPESDLTEFVPEFEPEPEAGELAEAVDSASVPEVAASEAAFEELVEDSAFAPLEPIAPEDEPAEIVEAFEPIEEAAQAAGLAAASLEAENELAELEPVAAEPEAVAELPVAEHPGEVEFLEEIEAFEKLPAEPEAVLPTHEESFAVFEELVATPEAVEQPIEELAPLDELIETPADIIEPPAEEAFEPIDEPIETFEAVAAEAELEIVGAETFETIDEAADASPIESEPIIAAEGSAEGEFDIDAFLEGELAVSPTVEPTLEPSEEASFNVIANEAPAIEEPLKFETVDELATGDTLEPLEIVEVFEEIAVEPAEEVAAFEAFEPVADELPVAELPIEEPLVEERPSAESMVAEPVAESPPVAEHVPFGEPTAAPQPAFFVDMPPPDFFQSTAFDGVYVQAPEDQPFAPPAAAAAANAAEPTEAASDPSPVVAATESAEPMAAAPEEFSEDAVIDFLGDAPTPASTLDDQPEAASMAAESGEFEAFFDAAEGLVDDAAVEQAAVEESWDAVEATEDAPAEPAELADPVAEEEPLAESQASVRPAPTKKPKKLPWFVALFQKSAKKKDKAADQPAPEPTAEAPIEAAAEASSELPEVQAELPAAPEAISDEEAMFFAEEVSVEDAEESEETKEESDAEPKSGKEKHDAAFDDFLKGL